MEAEVPQGGVITWHGKPPAHCEVCGLPIQDYFVDGMLRSGRWALMHPLFHSNEGMKLGLGRGQLYARQEDDTWKLIAGHDVGVVESVDDYLRHDGLRVRLVKPGRTYHEEVY